MAAPAARRIYGVETEYGLVGTTDGRRLPIDEAANRLFAPIAREFATTNLFHRAGGRLYLDIGSHPEYATPECTTAADLVTAQRAGDALLLDLAERAVAAEAEEGRDTTFRLFRNNIDPFGNTWGSHENYLVDRVLDPRHLGDWLVPFLVSRLLIGGAGHWRRGRFRLSQRGDVLGDLVSSQTTRSRPLINTRDEPHADPERHRRLHVISGDTNSLEHPMWLVVVATELVLRRAEVGGAPPTGPADPLAALRAWNADPDAGVPAADGSRVTARGLQRAYLAATVGEADDADETGPGWRAWRDALDALDAGRPSGLEWDAKLRTIRAWRDRHGVPDTDPRLDALDLRWHELGSEAGRPLGPAALWEARHGVRHTTDEAVAAATRLAPCATRARVRGALLAAAQAHGRDHAVDWSGFEVRDLPGGTVALRLDDPFAAESAAASGLVGRMGAEPRIRALGGFVPPPDAPPPDAGRAASGSGGGGR